MSAADDCILFMTRNKGEAYDVGVTWPLSADLSGFTFTGRFYGPHAETGDLTVEVKTVTEGDEAGKHAVHTVAVDECTTPGLWLFWIKRSDNEIYGPLGVLVRDVP